MIKWKKIDISTIKVFLENMYISKEKIAEKISNNRGIDKRSVKQKIDELLENERINKLCKWADRKKMKAKRKFKGGI